MAARGTTDIRIRVRSDFRAIAAHYAATERQIDAADASTLNRVASTVRTTAAREIRADLGGKLKISEIRKAIRIKRATRNAKVAIVEASGRKRLHLSLFNARQTKSGVRVRIGKRTYVIPHAFLARRDNVKIRAPSFQAQLIDQVQFRRRRVAGTGRPDYPIAFIMAPGVPTAFIQDHIQAALRSVINQRLPVEFTRQLRFRLGLR